MRARAALLTIPLGLACGVLATASTQNDPDPPARESAPIATWAQVEGPLEGRLVQGEISSSGTESADSGNRVFFVQSGSQAMQEMRARLADPEQRKVMRAEQRTGLEQAYADAEEELKIDSSTREALIELLVNQNMESMDAMFKDQGQAWPSMQHMAETENRKLDQLREVLGEDGLERYQEYTTTVYERGQVRQVDANLAAADKLSPEQKTRLVKLFKERNQMSLPPPGQARMSNVLRPGDPASPTFQQDVQRQSELATIEANEQSLRLRESSNRIMTERASGFLKPKQLAALAKVNETETGRQREWLVKARTKAGLDPAIPAHPDEESAPPRKAVSGEVWLDLVVRVNGGEPVHVTHTGRNGETLKFQASEDLYAEAEWTMYEDNWIDVRLTYFEEGPNGRRRLPGGSGFGTMGRIASDTRGGDNEFGARSMSSTMVTGRKAYSVELSATAEAR